MHEMSIAQSILDIALEEIAKQGCDRLDLIRVECGALAGVVPDSLQFCFAALVQGGLSLLELPRETESGEDLLNRLTAEKVVSGEKGEVPGDESGL